MSDGRTVSRPSVRRAVGHRGRTILGWTQHVGKQNQTGRRMCLCVCRIVNRAPLPHVFLQTVEKRIVNCAPLPRVFYKPLSTVLQTVHHSHAFFTNRGFVKRENRKFFVPLQNPRFVKNAWEWCTVCNTVLNGL